MSNCVSDDSFVIFLELRYKFSHFTYFLILTLISTLTTWSVATAITVVCLSVRLSVCLSVCEVISWLGVLETRVLVNETSRDTIFKVSVSFLNF